MKQKSRLKDAAKRIAAFTLGSVMTVTGVFADFTMPAITAEAATEEETVGTDIVNIAMKYLGYGYSQSSRNGANGTFDCSGLVKKVLEEAGFSGVPSNTSDWQSQISSGTLSLSYNGQYKDSVGFNGVKYASSLEEMYQMKDDDANNGYAIITKTAVTTDRLQDADLPAGSIVVTQATANSAAHAMIIAGDYSKQMPAGTTSANFWENYWTYYDKVVGKMAEDYPNFQSHLSSGRFVGETSMYSSRYSVNYTSAQVMDWPTGAAFTAKQPYWMMLNSSASSSPASSTLGSGTWVIDAASTTYGVRLTNKIGGKGGAVVPAYVITWPEETEYFAAINFHKTNQNNRDVSGAEFSVYSNEACTSKVATLAYSAGGKYSWTASWSSDEYPDAVRTYYVKETKIPEGYTADTNSSGQAAMWKVEVNGRYNTTTYYKRYGASGSWTKVRDGAINTYYLTVINRQKEATVNLSVHKTDNAGKRIANVEFTVYEKFDPATGALSGVLGTVTTDKNGEGTFSYELGTAVYSSKAMYIKETKVPDGYVMNRDVVYIRPIVGYYQGGTYYYGTNAAGYYIYNENGRYTLETSDKDEVFSLAGISEVVNYPEDDPSMCAGSYELSMKVENERTTSHYAYKTAGANTSLDDIISVTYQLYCTSSKHTTPLKVDGEKTSYDKSGAQKFRMDWSDLPYYDEDGNVCTYYAVETKVNGSAEELANYEVTYDGDDGHTVVTNTIRTVEHTFYKKFGNADTQNAVTDIRVQLYRNGKKYGYEVAVTAGFRAGQTAWAYQWTALPKYDQSGNEYRYYVEEVSVTYKDAAGMSHTIEENDIDKYFSRSTSNTGEAVLTSTTITNTLIPLYGAVSIEKVNAENETIKIKGVKYGVYSDEGCTKRIGDLLTTDASGTAVYTVAAPWYKIDGTTKTVYIKEYSTVSPYILDKTVYKVEITGSTKNAQSSTCTVIADGKIIGTSIKQFTQDNQEQYGQITVSKYGEVLTGFSGTTLIGSDGIITGYSNGTFSYEDRKMAGATFKLYAVGSITNKAGTITYTDGQEIAELTTDKSGTITFTGLPMGTYRIVETKAPAGQTVPKVHEWIKTLTYAGQTALITSETQNVNDALADAAVSVVKIDGMTSHGLADAYFGLYAAEDIKSADGTVIVKADDLVSVAKTDDKGNGIFKNAEGKAIDIPYGSYYVKELQTRDGYILSDEVYEFTFAFEDQDTYLKTFTHTFKDERMSASISIQKYDAKTGQHVPEGDASLDGAVYGLYAKEDIIHPDGHTGVIYAAGTQVAELITENGGKASIGSLYPGRYYVQELKPSEGYLLDTGKYDLIVVSDGVNHAATDITVYKNTKEITDTSDTPEYPIERPFQLIKVEGSLGDGDLSPLNGAGFTVYLAGTLVYKEDGSVDYENSPKTVIGKNGETEIFTDDLYDGNGTLLTSGYLKTVAVPYGKYLVHESTVPENMKQEQDFYVTVGIGDAAVFDQNGNPVQNNPEPKPLSYVYDAAFEARIKIIKRDKTTGQDVALAGTAFKIYDMDHQTYVVQTAVINGKKVQTDTFVTNDEGYLITPGTLHYGIYRIEEQTAPDGYYNSEKAEGIISTVKITVGTGFVFEGSNVDEYYDADLDCYVLPVVYYDEAVRGEIEVYKEGEVLDSYNKETKTFTWIRTGLAGAEYDVYANGDIYTPDHQTDEDGNRKLIYRDGELVGHITTGADGHAYLKDLPLGNYRIVETKAPYGYLLGDSTKTAQYAVLAYAGQNVRVVYDSDKAPNDFFNERPQADIAVVKFEKNEDGSTNTDMKLPGTTFDFSTTTDIKNYKGEVIVPAGTVLASVTTGADGMAAVDTAIKLPFGSYAFIETAVTPGYVLDQMPIPVSFAYVDEHTGVISVRAEQANDFIRLDVSKLDIANSAEVQGAKLAVVRVNPDGTETVVEEWISNGEPHRISRIPAGDYILREISAPTEHGYVKAEDLPFTVTETAIVQDVVMYDGHTELDITKTDFVDGSEVTGAVLQLIDAAGNIYAEWVSGDTANRNVYVGEDGSTRLVLEYIPVGTYTLREIQAPDGYEIAEDVTVVVKETGEIQRVTMTDQRTPEAKTTAEDAATGTHMMSWGETVTLKDTVNYKYLIPGKEYTVIGTVMIKETNEPLKDKNGNIVTAQTTFTPESRTEGSVEVEFTIDTTLIPNTTLVVFETVKEGKKTVIVHADIEDENQTVRVPEIGTTATDTQTGDHVGSLGEKVTIQDEVKYTNLTPGKEYVLTGTLYLKSTGKPLLDAEGKPYTAEKTFTAESENGTETLIFTIDTSKLAGEKIVAFESLTYKGIEIALEADLNDADQTVEVPRTGKIAVMKKGNVVTGTAKVETKYGTVNKLTFGFTYLAGVEFTVYADEACTKAVTKIVTNSDGLAVSEDLEAGTYYIAETYTPAGYAKDDTVYTAVIDGIAENVEGIEYLLDVTKDIVNHLCSSTLNIYKVGTDLEGSDKVIPLEGVFFGVYADEDITNTLGEVVIRAGERIAIIKTNSDGIATMTENLPSGRYYYKEIRTLDDFVLDDTEYRFEVSLENDDVEIDINKTNPLVNHAKNGTLTVHKVDQNDQPLGAGVEFLLTCVETGEKWTLVTDDSGVVSISGLPIGYIEDGKWVYYTYTLRETKTLEHYRLDETVYTFSFTAQSTDADAVYRSFTVRNVILGIRDYSMAGGIAMLLMAVIMLIMAVRKDTAESGAEELGRIAEE